MQSIVLWRHLFAANWNNLIYGSSITLIKSVYLYSILFSWSKFLKLFCFLEKFNTDTQMMFMQCRFIYIYINFKQNMTYIPLKLNCLEFLWILIFIASLISNFVRSCPVLFLSNGSYWFLLTFLLCS